MNNLVVVSLAGVLAKIIADKSADLINLKISKVCYILHWVTLILFPHYRYFYMAISDAISVALPPSLPVCCCYSMSGHFGFF